MNAWLESGDNMKRMFNLIKKLILTIEFLLTYDNDIMSYKKKENFTIKKMY